MDAKAKIAKNGAGETLPVLGTSVRFLLEAAATQHAFSIMHVHLPDGQGPPPHDHPWDEAYYIISGKVCFLIGETEHEFTSGDLAYVPGGMLHSFHGVGADGADVLIVDAPATAEGFFRDASREVVDIPADLNKVPSIGARYGMRFSAPPAAQTK